MNCHAPISDVCTECNQPYLMGIRHQCNECLDIVCVKCVQNVAAYPRDTICRRCYVDLLDETYRGETSRNAWLSTCRFSGIAVLSLSACVFAIYWIAKVLEHVMGGAK